MTRRNKLIVLSACLTMSAAFGVSVSPAAEDGKAFTVETDRFGTVYRVNMSKVKSPADLMTVPGVKLAWNIRGHEPQGYLANVRDLDGDGKIDLIASARMKDGVFYTAVPPDGCLLRLPKNYKCPSKESRLDELRDPDDTVDEVPGDDTT